MKTYQKAAALLLALALIFAFPVTASAALAAQADTVTRIFCGLPLELKG